MVWEKFKSLLLLLLTISSFILTGMFMLEKTGGLEASKYKFLDLPPANIELSEIIHPQGLFINFGGDSHTAYFFNSDDLRQEAFNAVKNQIEGEVPSKVDEKLWQTVLQERSIRVKYNGVLDADELFEATGGIVLQVDEVLIPLLGRDFILIKSDATYYKFSSNFDNTLEKLISEIE